jgi:hypothetical protein
MSSSIMWTINIAFPACGPSLFICGGGVEGSEPHDRAPTRPLYNLIIPLFRDSNPGCTAIELSG